LVPLEQDYETNLSHDILLDKDSTILCQVDFKATSFGFGQYTAVRI
jgi:hypothetical protein